MFSRWNSLSGVRFPSFYIILHLAFNYQANTRSMKELDAAAYTVGWISALPEEYLAAQVFLDEDHGQPKSRSPNDTNSYWLGSIGQHNVVIAVLPKGEYGTASAAGVAVNLLRSFPNVRVGLMVGIGGGAPQLPDHDIRLGDVVVSSPENGHGGVLQYDFGKSIQEKSFQYTRSLDQPPQALLTALAGLSTQHDKDGNGLPEAVDKVLKSRPRLKRKYGRPSPDTDLLFRSDVVHGDGLCPSTCGKDPTNTITRHEREPDIEDDLAVHYGTIASGNSLMKDAILRDRLAAEKNVLCFEMEAAGLMNRFPCLAIRGICDYSDSHKSKEWQGFAAMVAAAYAKDLICYLAPELVETGQRLSSILSDSESSPSKYTSIDLLANSNNSTRSDN
jgi:nucleoside phosphorylase